MDKVFKISSDIILPVAISALEKFLHRSHLVRVSNMLDREQAVSSDPSSIQQLLIIRNLSHGRQGRYGSIPRTT
jgi:hypothetical protein